MSEPAVFRSPAALRWLLAALGVLSAGAAGRAVWLAAERAQPGLLLVAAVLAVPCLLAGIVVPYRWEVRPDGVQVTGLVGRRFRPWASVRSLDRLRTSFVLETDTGPLRPLWLGRRIREEVFQAVIGQAGLTRVGGDLPWGVRARFVPRTAVVPVSHVQRRERRQRGDGPAANKD